MSFKTTRIDCGCQIITRDKKFHISCLWRPSSGKLHIFLDKIEDILEIQ